MPDSASSSAPIGFKEWAFVCEALGQGVQTIILRKGGIHEGMKGFSFQHKAFWLFPTGFHAQAEQLCWLPSNAAQISVPADEKRETVEFRAFAKLHDVWKITDWDQAAALAPFHVWKEEVVRERFAWGDDTCLHVALVRAYALPEPWIIPYQPGYGGCRSWVKLPAVPAGFESSLRSAMADAAWEQTAAKVREIVSRSQAQSPA
jgi:hypothetical protein